MPPELVSIHGNLEQFQCERLYLNLGVCVTKGPRLLAINNDFFGQGIFNADGDLWIHQRKVAAIEFATSRLRTFSTHIFGDYATRLAHRLLDKAKSKSQIDLQVLTTVLSNNLHLLTLLLDSAADSTCLLPDVIGNMIQILYKTGQMKETK